MLQSIGSQRIGQDLLTKQQQHNLSEPHLPFLKECN